MAPSRLSVQAVALRETVQRGRAIAEALRRSASRRRAWGSLEAGCHRGGHLVAWLRALKRLVNGGRAAGRCILVSRLSTVLKGIDPPWSERGRGLAEIMRDLRFEPEAVGDGKMNGNRALGTTLRWNTDRAF